MPGAPSTESHRTAQELRGAGGHFSYLCTLSHAALSISSTFPSNLLACLQILFALSCFSQTWSLIKEREISQHNSSKPEERASSLSCFKYHTTFCFVLHWSARSKKGTWTLRVSTEPQFGSDGRRATWTQYRLLLIWAPQFFLPCLKSQMTFPVTISHSYTQIIGSGEGSDSGAINIKFL